MLSETFGGTDGQPHLRFTITLEDQGIPHDEAERRRNPMLARPAWQEPKSRAKQCVAGVGPVAKAEQCRGRKVAGSQYCALHRREFELTDLETYRTKP